MKKDEKIKWFVSAIIPNERQVGMMQFESTETEHQNKAEELCPVRAEFRAYKIQEFEDFPIEEFIDCISAKKLGY